MPRVSHTKSAKSLGMGNALRTIFGSANLLNLSYHHFQQPGDVIGDVIFHMVRDSNEMLWWPDIVREARNYLAADDTLATFAAKVGIGPKTVEQNAPRDGTTNRVRIAAQDAWCRQRIRPALSIFGAAFFWSGGPYREGVTWLWARWTPSYRQ
jgi:hypothetical protein